MADRPLVEGHEGQAVLFDQILETPGQPVPHPPGHLAGVGALDLAQGVVPRRAGDGGGGHGAAAHGLGYLLAGGVQTGPQVGHAVGVATHAAGAGVAPGDDFAEYRQVRVHPEVALGAAETDAEPGHHLVEDQQGPVVPGQLGRSPDELPAQGPGAALWAHGLQENGGGAAGEAVGPELPLQVLQVVGEEFVGVLEHVARDPLGEEPLGAGDPDAVGQLVGPAVVGPAHLQDVLLPGLQPGDAHGHHVRLGAGAQHAEHLHRGHQVRDLLGQLVLKLVEQARGGAAGLQQLDDLVPHRRRVAAQDGGPPGLQQVVVPVAVDVVELGPLRPGDHDGEGVVEGQVVLHPAGDHLFGLGDHLLGPGALLLKVVLYIVRQLVPADGPHRLLDQLVQLPCHRRRVQILVDRESIVGHGNTSCLRAFCAHLVNLHSRVTHRVPHSGRRCQRSPGKGSVKSPIRGRGVRCETGR